MAIHSSGKAWATFVRRAATEVDARFPRAAWTSTYPGHGEGSAAGAYAVDFMVDSRETGDKIAAYVWKHRERLGVRYVIWHRRIISQTKLPSKWRTYVNPDPRKRGTASGDHTNHVHVSFFPNGRYSPPEGEELDKTPEGAVEGVNAPAKWVIRPSDLRLGVRSDSAYVVQRCLNNVNLPAADLVRLTGVYDTQTMRAAGEFQRSLGDDVDGLLGPLQSAALAGAARKSNPALPAITISQTPAAPARPKEEAPKVPDPYLEFELDAPGAGNWQGAGVRRDATGRAVEWYLGHSRKRPDGGEDQLFYRFTPDGTNRWKYRDKMMLEKGGHILGFTVLADATIITPFNGPDGNDVVSIKYRAGATYRKADCKQLHVFTDHPAQLSGSPTRTNVVIHERTSVSDVFYWRKLADVLANRDAPMGKVLTFARRTGDEPPLQGFTVIDDRLYLLDGMHGPAALEVHSFTTGEKLAEYDVTGYGFKPGEAEGLREPEGMDWRYFFVKVYTDDQRRLRAYRHSW